MVSVRRDNCKEWLSSGSVTVVVLLDRLLEVVCNLAGLNADGPGLLQSLRRWLDQMAGTLTFESIRYGSLAIIVAAIWLIPWWRRRHVRERKSHEVLDEIICQQALRPPQWKLVEGVEPIFTTVDGPFGPAVGIQPRKKYAIDHRFPFPCSELGSLELTVKRDDGFVFFARCKFVADDGNTIERWLAFATGAIAPYKHTTRGGTEWVVSIPESQDDDWETIPIDMAAQWKETFGKHGAQFIAITCVRLRGAMSLARIRVLK